MWFWYCYDNSCIKLYGLVIFVLNLWQMCSHESCIEMHCSKTMLQLCSGDSILPFNLKGGRREGWQWSEFRATIFPKPSINIHVITTEQHKRDFFCSAPLSYLHQVAELGGHRGHVPPQIFRHTLGSPPKNFPLDWRLAPAYPRFTMICYFDFWYSWP